MRASHARYWVILFAITLAVLSYIDRVAISQAAGPISHDLGLSKPQMGLVFGAFALSYALFEIPGGWLGDLMGPRRVLVRIVLAWSTFTALTGAAWSFASLCVIRFLFGAGEAGCFPNLTKVFSIWLPRAERVRTQGLMWAFARWGGAFTPPLVVLAFRYMSWRHAFVLFGGLGVVWCFFFFRWFKDHPRDHPGVNPSERELLKESDAFVSGHGDVPWKKLVSNGSILLLWTQYFCFSYVWYFYITWLPTYLQEFRHQTPQGASLLAVLPLLFGGFGSLVCGFSAHHLASWMRNLAASRRLIATTAMAATALLLLIVVQIENPMFAMLAMGLASFANDLVMPIAWNACMDIGGRYAGTVSGSMNMMGNLAGFTAPVIGGYVLQRTGGDWNLVLYIMAAVAAVGAVCWRFIDPVTSIDTAEVCSRVLSEATAGSSAT